MGQREVNLVEDMPDEGHRKADHAPLPGFLNSIRNTVMLAVMLLIWLVLLMVAFERFMPPFTFLYNALLPWKKIYSIPMDIPLESRLAIMRGLLEQSNFVAKTSFIVMILSFAGFSIFLTFVYQQKQRRARENRLLIMKNREIARRNEFIRYISATIGHEFKNNLGRIKRRLDLVEINGEAKRHISGNFVKLFADIAIFKKISDERESGLIDFQKLNMKAMLNELARQYSDLAEIRFEAKGESPIIFASQTLIKTVFENIIDNSIKYKKPEQPKAIIIVSCSMDLDGRRSYVSLSLKDEGMGMDEQQADKCFYKGSGIASDDSWGHGLYYVKYAVGLHAGRIKVGKEYTAPGRGTEIIINLPYVEESLYV